VAKENFGTKLSAKLDSRGILKIGESTEANITIATFPESLDADETIRTLGNDFWLDTIKHSKSIVDYHIDSIDGSQMFNAKSATAAANKILPLIAEVKSPVERDTYIRVLANKLMLSETGIRAEVSKIGRLSNGKTNLQVVPGSALTKSAYAPEVFEDIIMANLVKYYPESLKVESSDGTTITASDFDKEINSVILTKLAENSQSNSNLLSIKANFSANELAHFNNILSYCESQPELSSEEVEFSIKFLLDKLRKNQFEKVYNQIAIELGNSSDVSEEGYMDLVNAVAGISQLMKVYCH